MTRMFVTVLGALVVLSRAPAAGVAGWSIEPTQKATTVERSLDGGQAGNIRTVRMTGGRRSSGG
jgi:hypothetical protein